MLIKQIHKTKSTPFENVHKVCVINHPQNKIKAMHILNKADDHLKNVKPSTPPKKLHLLERRGEFK